MPLFLIDKSKLRAMEFILMEPSGEMYRSSSLDSINELLQKLEEADAEHPDVSVRQPNGWTLSASVNGDLIFENIESRPANPRHMKGLPREHVLLLMKTLATGNTEALENEPWLPGYPWSTQVS